MLLRPDARLLRPYRGVTFTNGGDLTTELNAPSTNLTWSAGTICGFIRHTSITAGTCVFGVKTAADVVTVFCNSTTTMGLFLTSYVNAQTVAANVWYFVAITFGASTTNVYIRALTAKFSNASKANHASGSGYIVFLGNETPFDDGSFKGIACGVRVWNRALTPLELYAESRQLAPATPVGLQNYLPLRDRGSYLVDEWTGVPWVSVGGALTGVQPNFSPPVPEFESLKTFSFGGGSHNYTGAISESVSASDAVARAFVGARALAESIAASDALARAFVGARSAAESVSASDTIARQYAAPRSIAESVSGSDNVARAFNGARSLAETVAASDAVARAFAGARPVAESVAVSDSVARTDAARRSVAESVSASDTIVRAITAARSVAETISASDALARFFAAARSIAESITAPSDAISKTGGVARSIAESVSASDAVSRAFAGARAIAESVSASDAVARAATYARSIAESLTTPSDSVVGVKNGGGGTAYTRSISESLSINDAVTRAIVGARSVTESIGASDTVARVTNASRSIAESIATPSDAVSRLRGAARSIAESISASDTLSRSFAGARSIGESVSASDALSRSAGYARSLAEAVSASDTVSRSTGAVVAIAEAIGGITDVLIRAWIGARGIVESILSPSDSVSAVAPIKTYIIVLLDSTSPVVSRLDPSATTVSVLSPTSPLGSYLQILPADFTSSIGTPGSTLGKRMTLGIVAIVRVGSYLDPTRPIGS